MLNFIYTLVPLHYGNFMYGIGCAWQDMFLGWRTTLVLDLNPCFAMREDPRTSDQVTAYLTLQLGLRGRNMINT